MIGALVVVICIGAAFGLVGRLAVPGRHGLFRVLVTEPRHALRLLAHDDEVAWEVGGGVLGAVGGYFAGRWYDGYSLLGPSVFRWELAVIGALVLTGIAVASGVIERSRSTRALGTHRGLWGSAR